MDPDTGHLLTLDEDSPEVPAGYLEVPDALQEEARQLLAERSETYVDLGDGSQLWQWVGDHRRRKAKVKTRNRRLRKERRLKRRR